MPNQRQRMFDASAMASSEAPVHPEDSPLPPVDPLELEAKYLLGLSLPATKNDVIETARLNDAPQRVLDVLERIDDREYENVPTLLGHVENVA